MSNDPSDKSSDADKPATGTAWGAGMPTQNIWLAGLGALAQAQADAQAEGRKAFETLVSQGMEMQAQSQEMAAKQWTEAAERLGAMTQQVAGANPSWNRLDGIFESRVQRALASLGQPGADDFAALSARVEELERALARLQAAVDKPAGTAAAAKKTASARKTRSPKS